MRFIVLLFSAGLCLSEEIPTDWRAAMNRVSAASLRGHVSFLASDALEGRATPSRGLDVAAEYIASRFRAAGLSEAPGGGYFHDTPFRMHEPDLTRFRMEVTADGKRIPVGGESVTVLSTRAVSFKDQPALLASKSPSADERAGKVVLSTPRGFPPNELLRDAKTGLVVLLDPAAAQAGMIAGPRLFRTELRAHRAPTILVHDKSVPADAKEYLVSVELPEPTVRSFPMRNVVGLIPGSDPALGSTYIAVTAHYDHLGSLSAGVSGDRVFNGANDDASGVACLLEIADVLGRMPQRPRRGVLFLAVSGEEKGLLGTEAWLDQPTVPLTSIVANINLEVMGRPDNNSESVSGRLTVSGTSFSTLGGLLTGAARDTGLNGEPHPQNEAFFARSDNVAFAKRGIPAHTVSSGYLYPDYHALSDEWDRLDYGNMAALTRAAVLAVLRAADSPEPPTWTDLPQTKRYRDVKRGAN